MPTKAVLRHVHVETPRTNHERKCAAHRTGRKAHPILSGDTHLVIVEGEKTFRYCREAAAAILALAQADLSALQQQLGLKSD
ncbi:hypothetical protein [Mycolicibacterium fortuitum]|uniref:hypothetical protein n=1 Tax=Mycolicibacterium fortuitum TaxID=1766 RepID=UPI001CDBC862|nr:hypothetical protein [Mycolicibacterium fortuitum]UBV15337.1 hypothetical protein H8Z57_32585 [Mycolicibacterium fortuitum]